MPQVELKYTNDLFIEAEMVFSHIETALNDIDSTAKTCKSRAFCMTQYLHSHVYLEMKLLRKPHRDADFMQACLKMLDDLIKPYIPLNTYYSINLEFMGEYYLTDQLL